jgi:large subunit ribosomal protein L29
MKMKDVNALSAEQRKEEVLKLKKEALNLRFQRASGQAEKPSRLRLIRRDVARLKTAETAAKAGAKKEQK